MTDENASVNELTGRVVVVTGANSGIGLAAAREFARRGARVALVGRDQARLDAAVAAIGGDARGFTADFTSLDSVRALAAALRDAYPRIDVLANNAGGAFGERRVTADGFETTIQVNHLAPFLLTHLLRDRLDGGRVVNTASDAHQAGKLDPADLNSDAGPFRMFTVYGSSKQANIAFAAEAARRWPEINSFSYHPGVVKTRFGRDKWFIDAFYKAWPFLRSPEKGADTLVWLASAPLSDLYGGGYYVDRKLKQPNRATTRPGLADDLWTASEKALNLS